MISVSARLIGLSTAIAARAQQFCAYLWRTRIVALDVAALAFQKVVLSQV